MNPSLPIDSLVQGDCREVLAGFPPDCVDLIFADPPYNLQLQQELYRPNRTRVDAVTDSWDRFSSFEEYDEFTRQWLSACRRVLKDDGALWVIGTYHNIHRIGAALQDLGFWILNETVWIKDNPMPNFRGVRFTNAHETLIWAVKDRKSRYTFNHQAMKALNEDLQMRSDWRLPICSGPERLKQDGKKLHSTQKPESLLYRVLLASTHPGDVVLDPFFGTGTTGAVARRMGRHWIGIEKEERYLEPALRRIAAVEPAAAEALDLPRPSRARRLPFGNLIEAGLLHPGDCLYLDGDLQRAALLLADGRLRVNGFSGSIHQAAAHLLGGPANGWEHWHYRDGPSLRPVSDLRAQLLTGQE